jgi:hypothetical protein
MTDFPGWTYDAARREYYYFSSQENCFITQSGVRIASSETKREPDPITTEHNTHELDIATDPELANLGVSVRGQINERNTGKGLKALEDSYPGRKFFVIEFSFGHRGNDFYAFSYMPA